ncbi:HEAT repeat domain-containing protein [Vampirovibrio sp.]|uniref:HEAT repeat domain-containing protein n=1 Tax=Vampirovibrio sp. TaxID=2717857 RepID=UPI00359365A5
MSSFIPIKKIKKRTTEGQVQVWFAVPSMAIATPQGRVLIPNPSGAEAALFPSVEEAEEAIRRAGFDYEFEGKQVFAFNQPAGGLKPTALQAGASPLEQAVPLLIQQLKDRESSVVANAAYALGSVRAYAALDALSAILGHDDPGVRKQVAEAMARLGAAALPKLTAAYEQARTNTGKQAPYIRLTILSAFLEMVEHGNGPTFSNQFLPLAVTALGDDSWLVKAQAALLIGRTAQSLEEERRRAEQKRP